MLRGEGPVQNVCITAAYSRIREIVEREQKVRRKGFVGRIFAAGVG